MLRSGPTQANAPRRRRPSRRSSDHSQPAAQDAGNPPLTVLLVNVPGEMLMFFTAALYLALAIFAAGALYRIAAWFTRKVGFMAGAFTPTQRLWAAMRGIVGVIFSARVVPLIRTLILDVGLQLHIARQDRLRWIMHLLIYGGFSLLVLMHALETHITAKLFSNYYPTLNPFFFLRDLFGLMVVAGVAIAVWRRFILKVPRMRTNWMDRYAIAIVALIIVSGILLGGAKMASYTEFINMVEDYSFIHDDEELEALESYWVAKYATVSPNVKGPFPAEVLALGHEVHMTYCADCHAPNQSAFVSYATAKAIGPIAPALERARGTTILWYLHILACFAGLAYLPFSKLFHLFSTSVSLLANAVMDPQTSLPANIATRQALELDACMHCGTCNLRCSVAVAFEANGNPMVLPAEKLAFLRRWSAGKALSRQALAAIAEGVTLCTNCDRCTVVCPAGISLKELWLSVREPILARSAPLFLTLSPLSLARGLNRRRLPAAGYDQPMHTALAAMTAAFPLVRQTETPIPITSIDQAFGRTQADNPLSSTFAYCYACENCTTVCPVVNAFDDPQEAVGLLPHQIMRSLGLGQKELALGSAMLWDCVTCYQCQEHCPQGVKVTDLLYQLKNRAVGETVARTLKSPAESETP